LEIDPLGHHAPPLADAPPDSILPSVNEHAQQVRSPQGLSAAVGPPRTNARGRDSATFQVRCRSNAKVQLQGSGPAMRKRNRVASAARQAVTMMPLKPWQLQRTLDRLLTGT
jgi:hypothetical protein